MLITSNIWLVLPLLICLAAGLLVALLRFSGLKQRLGAPTLGWFLSIAPLSAFLIIIANLNLINNGNVVVWQFKWIPTIDLDFALYIDGISALFALIVTGIGFLVVVYAGYYFKGDPDVWRFMTFLMLFMTSMLGIVMAGDLISLFVFWEGTSITSFLLIGFKHKDKYAREGAFKSLYITGIGGLGLLAGFIFMGSISGSFDLATILSSGDIFRESVFYPVVLGLVAIGAFTKSAQVPAHIWLPDAMAAPTPVSAYLHSATMVKAGVYLMARLNPVLGSTDGWFWMLSLVGLVTMLTGAYLGFKQNDLKALLAYSTISQLGMLMMLIGQDTPIAYKALVIGIVAHALYKCALFMVVGIVDHETGTRDLRYLGGMRRFMPLTFIICGLGALSMAGLPPLFGFIAKETLLATVSHAGVTQIIDLIFPATAILSGALIIAQSGLLFIETFLSEQRDVTIHAHEAPLGMIFAPAVPAFLSLAFGILPEPRPLVTFLSNAAEAVHGAEVEVVIALWAGLTIPFFLSVIAIMIGVVLIIGRHYFREIMGRILSGLTVNRAYKKSLALIDTAAFRVSLVQNGKLRTYMVIIFLAIGGMIWVFSAMPPVNDLLTFQIKLDSFSDGITFLKLITLLFIIGTAFASVILERDLPAIIAVGASGLSVAVLMMLEPAPDIALVQVVVDILMTIILVLLLTRLPRLQREKAAEFTFLQSRPSLIRDGIIAGGATLLVTAVVYVMLISRPRESIVTPFYEHLAEPLTGAKDIVGAIILDFRALDTLFEITVFGVAALGVYTLLRYASREAGDIESIVIENVEKPRTMGIGGELSSPFVRVLAYVILPLSLIIGFIHMAYGHDQPGDGFTAGVIVSLAVGLWYVVFGYLETKRLLPWLKSIELISAGILLIIITGVASALITGVLLAPVDFGEMIGINFPKDFHFSSGLLFEIAIALTVLGGASLVIDTLGRPKDIDFESKRIVEEISGLEILGQVTREESSFLEKD
jgi:NADH:ubiquinone oxidoreductase subunit 5 (subunit L)/multisubunit Na+/H+ antiporter MnhA subunit/multisubunit Na+/H+ antiporter MnhB subunit